MRSTLGVGTLALVALAGLVACDGTATKLGPLPSRGFTEVEPIAAYPAVMRDGVPVRVCSADSTLGKPDTVIVSFALLATTSKSKPGQDASRVDRDRSIRPGDLISRVVVGGPKTIDIKVNPVTVEWKVDCLDPMPDSKTQCDGLPLAEAASSLAYRPRTEGREDAFDRGHDVLVLLGHHGTLAESDPSGRRFSAVKELIATLNARDRVGVLTFGEGLGADGVRVPCALPATEGLGWEAALDACWTEADREGWTTGIEALEPGGAGGRSNLWGALGRAWDFLKERADGRASQHIIVVTDGPDTCRRQSESFAACEPETCASLDPRALIDQLEDDAADPEAARVSVHFVQFESPDHPGPDPRQMEAACVTGGHYQRVDSNALSSTNEVGFQKALTTATNRVRYSLQGVWEATIPLPELAKLSVPPGQVYALSGLVEVKPQSHLVTQSQTFTFSNPGSGSHDDRLLIHKPCRAASDCGGAEDGPCSESCSTETALCRPDPALPDGVTCRDGSGTCCGGECLADGALCEACE